MVVVSDAAGAGWGEDAGGHTATELRAVWGHPNPSVSPKHHGQAPSGAQRTRGALWESRWHSASCRGKLFVRFAPSVPALSLTQQQQDQLQEWPVGLRAQRQP